ncbi:hypothetical protein BU16DRAFT_269270 [Lophium mytilinum]|uniref:Uncharacterized protein n=1 Tax=Lophium mytilinum TaxID=390894 RepID=A0A6A6R4Y1_9PEZI|nr:hypothetical protein BU16DRAFT_269270 [Lophium mytilinum]
MSWTGSLQKGDITDALQDHPSLSLDRKIAKSKLSLVKRDDPYYIAIPKDSEDYAQTKATREFLNSEVKNPSKEIVEIHLPGTGHVIAWGCLQLTGEAKVEVEGYIGVEAPLGDDSEVWDD